MAEPPFGGCISLWEEAAVEEEDGDFDAGYGDGPEVCECVLNLVSRRLDGLEHPDVVLTTHFHVCLEIAQPGPDEVPATPKFDTCTTLSAREQPSPAQDPS